MECSECQPLMAGEVTAPALILTAPLSLWGGVDPDDGSIIDRHHPQLGASIAGRVMVMPHGRGSSSASSVLAEMIRNGTGPAGIVLSRPDPILLLGVVVAAELYDRLVPTVVVDRASIPSDVSRIGIEGRRLGFDIPDRA